MRPVLLLQPASCPDPPGGHHSDWGLAVAQCPTCFHESSMPRSSHEGPEPVPLVTPTGVETKQFAGRGAAQGQPRMAWTGNSFLRPRLYIIPGEVARKSLSWPLPSLRNRPSKGIVAPTYLTYRGPNRSMQLIRGRSALPVTNKEHSQYPP